MPKIVDHEARRAEISAALWRIVTREGIGEVSIRAVAKEAGYPKATAMHYFANEAELLMYAMDESIARSRSLVAQFLESSPDLAGFVKAILHAIPTSQAERNRTSIWLEIVSKSQSDPTLREYLLKANAHLDRDLETLLRNMQTRGLVTKRRNLKLEARTLHALIDGLSLHTMTSHSVTTPSMIKKIVSAQVQELSR
ncbi:MAG: TetR family transcriptional regulator C-terminal domain-containing protein [Candidatus Nanopelagicales bacterium]